MKINEITLPSIHEDLSGGTNYLNLIYLAEAKYMGAGSSLVPSEDVEYLEFIPSADPIIGEKYIVTFAACFPNSVLTLNGSRTPIELIEVDDSNDVPIYKFANGDVYPIEGYRDLSYIKTFLFLDRVQFRAFLSAVGLKFKTTTNLKEAARLTESSSTNILVVDVQPAYASHSDRVLPAIQDLIAKSTGKIAVLYNGDGTTEDDLNSVLMYLTGESEEDYYDDETEEFREPEDTVLKQKLQGAKFFEKTYGFFRGWMDQGVDDAAIIKTVRAMAQARTHDSRDLDNLPELLGDQYQDWMEDDSLQYPDAVSVAFLKQISPFYMVGGGRQECLREIELLCNAFNIRFKRVDSMTY